MSERVVLLSETEVGLTVESVTVTVQVAVLPLTVFAVIVAVPFATAVIFPFETVATDDLLVVQATVLSEAFDGETVAVIVWDAPLLRVIEVLLRETEVG